MKRIVLVLLAASVANAGIIRVVTYPVRHPVKLVKKTGHVVKLIIW